MNSGEWMESIQRQLTELTDKYRGLFGASSGSDLSVLGTLSFSAEFNGVLLEDEYAVEIAIPPGYPQILPIAKETGGRIPRDFHTYSDEILCLGSPIETIMTFRKRETLIGFVEDLLIPFLYGFSYRERYGVMPYGELSHGINGILESYKGLFHVDDVLAVIAFLKILADDNYRGHIDCPCRSGLRLRNCHGDIMRELRNYLDPGEFLKESLTALHALKQNGQDIPLSLIPQTLIKRFRKYGKGNKLIFPNHFDSSSPIRHTDYSILYIATFIFLLTS